MAKVVAISFGRKMSNTDVMLKEVLKKCEEAGHEIQFVRPDDLNIGTCTGCTACVVGIMSGRNNGECAVHPNDDFHIVEDAFYSADALIIGSPVYETSPTGTFKTFCDRLGPSHDLAFLTEAKKERIERDGDKALLPDERVFKPRVGCLLAVGGARTENWTIMTIPVMYECMMSTGVDVIDTHVYYGAMNYQHVLGVPEQMERMDRMAQNIIDALAAADNEEERTKWRGEDDGACPVCHQSMFKVHQGAARVECAICGIDGEVTVEDGKIRYIFSEKEQARSRMKYAGKLEHRNEIANGAMTQIKVEGLAELKKPYLHIGE
ncbi:MAG: flavodoxin family protein [Lachnospiraceae bacterium]|nr:flavodoxin family protein [Lachnospiraceae bacterium]